MDASCQCATISFRTPTSKPLAIYICHCRECRKQSSSAFGVSAIFPYFELPAHLRPQLGCYVRETSTPGKRLKCYFCRLCGVRVLHFSVTVKANGDEGKDEEELPDSTVSVKGGCLDEVVEVLPAASLVRGISSGSESVKDAEEVIAKKNVQDVQRWDEEPDDGF
ncbi:hypothetical protein L228DRAFT_261734 [Xylona heveae TC161]|uniref:CENP-V/GFA domain-containing protein n=1 Tax=Xylona heveae (strain CBS 132557 / TC161) TaxID=1328760 RepID=A0A165FZW6_XYLHT|nr:hypothetical protein L228DRAFT_261734 [Xylona heveae TC161]KZF21577.1 hypothetical protein L228DRAFT_261734 [Xylona heveae TC161]